MNNKINPGNFCKVLLTVLLMIIVVIGLATADTYLVSWSDYRFISNFISIALRVLVLSFLGILIIKIFE